MDNDVKGLVASAIRGLVADGGWPYMTPDEQAEALAPLLADALSASRDENAKLAAFKAYVHQRLDEGGVPENPGGPHTDQGCRIGDRLDYVFDAMHAMANGLSASDAEKRDAALEEAAKVAKAEATCGRNGAHGRCNVDDGPLAIATAILSLRTKASAHE